MDVLLRFIFILNGGGNGFVFDLLNSFGFDGLVLWECLARARLLGMRESWGGEFGAGIGCPLEGLRGVEGDISVERSSNRRVVIDVVVVVVMVVVAFHAKLGLMF